MSLKERAYSILVVSAADNFNSAFSALLSDLKYNTVHVVPSVSAAKRVIAERAFDFIIINSPLPDDFGTRFAIDMCAAKGTVVLLLVRGDVYQEVYEKVSAYGVFALGKPTAKNTLLTALNWMVSARERLRTFEKKTYSIEEKMEEIRLVNRAKWLLISELKMSEPDAHRYIEKEAMDRCVSKRELAGEIIKTYS